MSMQEVLNDLGFQILPDHVQKTIKDKDQAMSLIKEVAGIHEKGNMEDYQFIEERKEIAFWIIDYWKEKYNTLSNDEKEFFDYVEQLKA